MKILVAEDDRVTMNLLKSFLNKWGYEIVTASNGIEAWEIFQTQEVDIALLDWMIPELDGISLIKRIRKNKDFKHIYTIILTSKGEKGDIVQGLDVGADDYIVKPFHAKELKSRLNVGIRLIEYRNLLLEKNRELDKKNKQMQKLVEQRTEQLLHVEKMSTVGILCAGITHEINNPSTFIAGNIQTLYQFWDEIRRIIEREVQIDTGVHSKGVSIAQELKDNTVNKQKLEFILKKMPQLMDDMDTGVKRITRIVDGLRVFSRRNKEEKVYFNIEDSINIALKLCHNKLKNNIKVQKEIQKGIPQIFGVRGQIEQVFVNLLINAVDAMEKIKEAVLKIKVIKDGRNIMITVEDNGHGIPEEDFNYIWQPFFTTKKVGQGTGLGLSISFDIIEKHGGKIKAENFPDNGAKFTVILPDQFEKLDTDLQN